MKLPRLRLCSSADSRRRLPDESFTPLADEKINQIKTVGVCHVWTAPAVQEESDVSANGRVRSCIRPVVAAALATGHDVIRKSGPNQKHALVSRVAHNGLPDQRSTVSHHVVFTPANRERYAESHMALLPTFS